MKNFKKLYVLLFCFGILSGYMVPNFMVKNFLVDFEEKMQSSQIKYDKFSLKNCAPKDELHGENWIGNDLIEAFSHKFSIMEHVFQNEEINDDSGVNLYLRGYLQYSPPFPDNKHINMVYLFYPIYFSHYDESKLQQRASLQPADYGYKQSFFDEIQFYDAIAVGSKKYADMMNKSGLKAYYVPQFTNPDRFYPEYDENLQSEVLFIGTRPQVRKAPEILLNHKDIPLTLYGPESDGLALVEYIDNDELHKYYTSAKIVLNDHRDDMRQYGFINNRTFDVTASGGFLISDYMPEIEEIYGDSVPMWKTEEELIELVKYYLNPEHEAERKEKAERARQITLDNFTVNIVVNKIYDIIEKIKQQKGVKK